MPKLQCLPRRYCDPRLVKISPSHEVDQHISSSELRGVCSRLSQGFDCRQLFLQGRIAELLPHESGYFAPSKSAHDLSEVTDCIVVGIGKAPTFSRVVAAQEFLLF